jgi:8-oxo-dGTP diphosphatase
MEKFDAYLQSQPDFVFVRSVVGYCQKNDQVLLGVRKKVSFGLGKQLIAGIGGKVEPNETDAMALEREILEEVGIKITAYREMGQVSYLFPHKPKWSQSVRIFVVDAWDGEPQETDVIQPIWFPADALPAKRMWPDNLLTIPLVLSGKNIRGKFLYKEDGTIEEYMLEESNAIIIEEGGDTNEDNDM